MTLRHVEEYRDPETARKIVSNLKKISRKPVRLMEVCGTHTMSIFRNGIRSLLPDTISLVSGPGCPVCVTSQKEIDTLIEIAGKEKLFAHNPELFNTVTVVPKLKDTFWVSLIGKGYPSPNRWFRWCTERIKINPTTSYILNTVNKNGQAIIILGSRRAESGNRAAAMTLPDYQKRLLVAASSVGLLIRGIGQR